MNPRDAEKMGWSGHDETPSAAVLPLAGAGERRDRLKLLDPGSGSEEWGAGRADLERSLLPSWTGARDQEGEPRANSVARETGNGRRGHAGGELDQPLALAAPESGQGGRGAEYGPYLARVRERIHRFLSYPPSARRRGLTGTVHMEIVIRPNGAIGSVALLRSSSHRILDQAAVDAVRRLPRLPFPAELVPRNLRVRLPVVFELR
ncbi:MAG: energy transducer TonB [Candidatus Methylomirabilia bacterium]